MNEATGLRFSFVMAGAAAVIVLVALAWLRWNEGDSEPIRTESDHAANTGDLHADSVSPGPDLEADNAASREELVAADADQVGGGESLGAEGVHDEQLVTNGEPCPVHMRSDFELICVLMQREKLELSPHVLLPHHVWGQLDSIIADGAARVRDVDGVRREALGRVIDARKARGEIHKFRNPATIQDPAEKRIVEQAVAAASHNEDPRVTIITGGNAESVWVIPIHAREDGHLSVAYDKIDQEVRVLAAQVAVMLAPFNVVVSRK